MIGNGTVLNEWKLREQMCEIGRLRLPQQGNSRGQ